MQIFNYEEISIVKGAFVLNLMYAHRRAEEMEVLTQFTHREHHACANMHGTNYKCTCVASVLILETFFHFFFVDACAVTDHE